MRQTSCTIHATPFGRSRRKPFTGWILAVVFAFLMLGTASAQLPNERCVGCHGQVAIVLLPIQFGCGAEASPYVDQATFLRSAHAKLACVDCHRTSHPEFSGVIGPRTFPSRREYAREIEQACLDCHKLFGQTGDDHAVAASHSASAGDAPLCVDCHSAHETTSVAAHVAGQVMEETKSWSAMFATKGIEYLLVIGYLLLFVPFAILLHRITHGGAPLPRTQAVLPRSSSSWFQFPEGFHLHRGHTWAHSEGGGVFKVGMDDFARRLIGEPTAVMLPSPGKKLDQGERGWQVGVYGNTLDLLSPVRGEVIEVNEQAVNAPAVVSDDPYGEGWLMKVRAPQPRATTTNLLSDRLARAWYDELEEELGGLMEGCSGTVLQDGGVPMSGFARELAGERWPELAAKFLLTE